jgi:hypothetical protein
MKYPNLRAQQKTRSARLRYPFSTRHQLVYVGRDRVPSNITLLLTRHVLRMLDGSPDSKPRTCDSAPKVENILLSPGVVRETSLTKFEI